MIKKDQVVVIAKSAIYNYSSEAIVEILPSGVLLVTDNGTKHYFSPCGWWEAVEQDG